MGAAAMVGGTSSRESLDPRVAVWVPGASSVPEHQLCEPIKDFLLKLLSPGGVCHRGHES